jgi:ubiquitin conjugation factor E4 B
LCAYLTDLRSREPNPSTDSLAPHLLFESGEDGGICPDFLNEVVSRWEEDDAVRPMITKAVVTLSKELAMMTMRDNYKPYMNV